MRNVRAYVRAVCNGVAPVRSFVGRAVCVPEREANARTSTLRELSTPAPSVVYSSFFSRCSSWTRSRYLVASAGIEPVARWCVVRTYGFRRRITRSGNQE